jgi:hypothetical protein
MAQCFIALFTLRRRCGARPLLGSLHSRYLQAANRAVGDCWRLGGWDGLGELAHRRLRRCVVYAMKVTSKLTMARYDAYTRRELRRKIPYQVNGDRRRGLGDSIYDFSSGPPVLRPSVHDVEERRTDLGGRYILLSNHFYYFGDHPRRLPDGLLPIVKHGQGHRSRLNARYEASFVSWLEGLALSLRTLFMASHRDLREGEQWPVVRARHCLKRADADELLGSGIGR